MDGDCYVRRLQVPALDRAGSAMSERYGADAQPLVSHNTARRSA